jgi:hypothetical protein
MKNMINVVTHLNGKLPSLGITNNGPSLATTVIHHHTTLGKAKERLGLILDIGCSIGEDASFARDADEGDSPDGTTAADVV